MGIAPTLDELVADKNLPATLSVPVGGAYLGLGRSASYSAARRGELPTIALGRRLVVPTARLLEMLGVSRESSAT